MNRFKFRAWDAYNKRMIHESDEFAGYWFHSADNGLHCGYMRNTDWVDCPIMQFTGLCDKNGTYIFDGDILRWSTLIFPIVVNDLHSFRFMFGKDNLNKAYARYGEIIGDIYQTPELLARITKDEFIEQHNPNFSFDP